MHFHVLVRLCNFELVGFVTLNHIQRVPIKPKVAARRAHIMAAGVGGTCFAYRQIFLDYAFFYFRRK